MQQSYDSATKSAEMVRSPVLGRAISLDVSWATRDVSSATRDVSWVTRETSRGCAVLGIHDRPGGRFSTPPGGDSQRGMFGGYAGLRLRRQELHRGRWHPIGRRANSMACVTGSRPNPYIDRFDTFLCRKRALASCPWRVRSALYCVIQRILYNETWVSFTGQEKQLRESVLVICLTRYFLRIFHIVYTHTYIHCL